MCSCVRCTKHMSVSFLRLCSKWVYLGRPKKGILGTPGRRAWKAILAVFQRVLALFGFLWLPGALFIKKNLMKTDHFMFSNQETNEKVPYDFGTTKRDPIVKIYGSKTIVFFSSLWPRKWLWLVNSNTSEAKYCYAGSSWLKTASRWPKIAQAGPRGPKKSQAVVSWAKMGQHCSIFQTTKP
jgi:hypothetical protein